MASVEEAARQLRTAVHLRPVQLLWRLRFGWRQQAERLLPGYCRWRLRLAAAVPRGGLAWDHGRLGLLAARRRERAGFRASDAPLVLEGGVRLTGQVQPLGRPVDWSPALRQERLLAFFELHYMAYLEDLARAWSDSGDRRYLARWVELVESWIAHNPPTYAGFRSSPWFPYVVSERVRCWLASYPWVADHLEPATRARVERSLAQQVAYLERNLERDSQGNHLLQNLMGVVVARAGMGGRGAGPALNELARQLQRQLLADGLQHERSFMYQVRLLADLLEVLDLLDGPDGGARPAIEILRGCAGRMAGLLQATLDLLGDLPLMNDTRQQDPELVRWLLRQTAARCPVSEPEPGSRLRGSGYLTGALGPRAVVFDVGAAGPRHQLAHAHADHLGLELWCRGHKLLRDSGCGTFSAGERRQWYRGTAAHSTISVDGASSLEAWAAFRVGRRPARHAARVLAHTPDEIHWYGTHDGYRHLPGRPRLEWLFRLALEPRRMWYRYLVVPGWFLYRCLRWRAGERQR